MTSSVILQPSVHLTVREREVLYLLCEGLPNKLISRRLGISLSTVKIHISNILSELGVSSRLQAVIAARRLGLLRDLDHVTAADAVQPGARPLRVYPSVPGHVAV